MSIATQFGRGASYYATHRTVPCPDCGLPADADFKDHAPSTGTATKHHPIATYRSCIYVQWEAS